MAKQLKQVHHGKFLSIPRFSKCAWCEYGRDPVTVTICANCHAQFKRLLCANAWRTYRLAFLAATPWCKDPLNCHAFKKMADVVDHILPWSRRPSLFWEATNLQGLCFNCHTTKTRTDGSFDSSPHWGKTGI